LTYANKKPIPPPGLKPKDLCLIPQRLAIALQEGGWWVRSTPPWLKVSAMPSSVQDRPGVSHEVVLMLTKEERYYWDMDAVRTPHTMKPHRSPQGRPIDDTPRPNGQPKQAWPTATRHEIGVDGHPNGRNRRTADWWFESLDQIISDTEAWLAHAKQVKARGGVLLNPDGAPIGFAINPQPTADQHYACVDEDTECLTVHGWKRHNEVTQGMFAAQFDIATGQLSWGKIQDVNRYTVEDEQMVAAVSANVSLLLTANHRTLISRVQPSGERKRTPLVVIEAGQLKTSHAIPVSAPWIYSDDHRANEWPLNEHWAELLGWYIAEGHGPAYEWNVEIYQSLSANPLKVIRIEQLLKVLGIDYRKAEAQRVWKGQIRWAAVFQIRGFGAIFLRQWAPNKGFHEDTLKWPAAWLRALLNGLIDGDGHRRLEDQRFSFYQKNKSITDMVQAIGVRLGYATKITRRSEGTHNIYFTTKRLLSFRGTGGEGAKIGLTAYTGIVWCPSLPLGTWVARKHGRAFITGNSFPARLIRPMVLASTSAHGCCGQCLAPWQRVVTREKGIPASFNGSSFTNGKTHDAVAPLATVGKKPRTVRTNTLGWEPTCAHPSAPIIPCTVLDPFAGRGTSLLVAHQLGRQSLGVELSADYCRIIQRNLQDDAPLLDEWAHAVERIGRGLTADRQANLFEAEETP